MRQVATHETEGQLHKTVVEYLAYALPADSLVIHVPNEGKRGWKAQAALKHNGLLKGAPDLIILWRRIATFIEMKSAKGVVSKEQKAVHQRLRDAGFQVFICRSLDQVYEAVNVAGIPQRRMDGIPGVRSP